MAKPALACEFDMSSRSRPRTISANILRRLRVLRERRPAIVPLAATFAAGSLVIGSILLRERMPETAPQPRVTYEQCGSVQDNDSRLACFDEVLRQTSVRAAKDANLMPFGEFLGGQRSIQARDAWATKR
jgi:hypothetical protein